MTLALITRCKNEPFIHEFIAYYINEGVDKIYIYDDNSDVGTYDKIDSKYLDNITILNVKSFTSNRVTLNGGILKHLYNKVKSFDWVINVDVDEFITSNDKKTIRTHLETTYKNVDRIKIPWVMMTRNGRVNNPQSLLKDTTYRWNHDLPHVSKHLSQYKFRCYSKLIPCKSVFKPIKFKNCGPHNPYSPYNINTVVSVDSVNNEPFNMSTKKSIHYQNFNEVGIKNATLLCYHYRIFSEECIRRKLNGCLYNFNASKMLGYDYPEIIDTKMRDKAIQYSL